MACPVCFGGEDTAMRESLNAGIGVLMGVTAIVLAGFARFIVMLVRRSRDAHLVSHDVRLPPSHTERATATLADVFGGGGKPDTTVRVTH
jgi:hypothetical protein